ncbi:MAG: PqqD family peptide modification chaperone, partial [Thermoplasmata archaeon]|nr:PqqD family peptide modification chaperone [Thermoplasmata archaeon]
MKPYLSKKYQKFKRDELTLLIEPDSGKWFFSKDEGLSLLELCDGEKDLNEILDIFSSTCDGDPEAKKKDVEVFIKSLESSGILGDVKPNKIPRFTEFYVKNAWLHLTDECNLRCKYCYRDSAEAFDNELSIEEQKGIIDQVKELGHEETDQWIVFTGGEPLLKSEMLWELASYAKEKGMSCKLVSNGLLIDKEAAKKIKSLFGDVNVSIDGLKDSHDKLRGKGNFDRAMRGIENLIEEDVKFSIGAVMTRENLDDIPNLLKLAKQINAAKVLAAPVWITGRANSELMLSNDEIVASFRKLMSQAEEPSADNVLLEIERFFGAREITKIRPYGCGAGVSLVSFGANGDIYPCVTMHLPAFKAGNIRNDSLKDVWDNSPVFQEFRGFSIDDVPECEKCTWKRFCHGACKLNAYVAHGTIKAPGLYCKAYATLYEDAIWNYGARES